MSDRDWRAWERRVQAAPGDQEVLHAAIAARQRAQLPVPAWMLAQQRFEGRRFDSLHTLDVTVLTPEGRPVGVGRTPTEDGAGLELPPHRTFWVQPEPPTDAALAALVDELTAAGVPGLALGPDVTFVGLALLKRAPQLTWLDLSGCPGVDARGLTALGPLGGLATLKLWGCRLDGVCFYALAALTGLSSLDLGQAGGPWGEDVLARLAPLGELAALSLARCAQVGDAGLAHLRGLPRLTALDLRGCGRVTDAGLAHLAALPELTLLNLSRCRGITLEGLAALRELPHLSRLYLVGCGLDERKVPAALDPRVELVI